MDVTFFVVRNEIDMRGAHTKLERELALVGRQEGFEGPAAVIVTEAALPELEDALGFDINCREGGSVTINLGAFIVDTIDADEDDDEDVEDEDAPGYADLTNDALREILEARGLHTSGDKATLVDRLEADDAEDDEADDDED